MNTNDLKSFHYLENGEISFSNYSTIKSSSTLEPGFYDISYIPYPKDIVSLKLQNSSETIKIHEFPDKDKLDELFNSFFDQNVLEAVNKLGFYHKVGVLLHGREGTGKSTIIRHYCKNAIENNKAIVFYFNTISYMTSCWTFISSVRSIQANPIIVIFEEMDITLSEVKSTEATLKKILDGNMSIHNCIFFGTTNYIEQIPTALKDRPSRFKYSLPIEGIQNKNDVENILVPLLGSVFGKEDIATFADSLKGSTLDEIKQFSLDKLMDIKSYPKQTSRIGFRSSY